MAYSQNVYAYELSNWMIGRRISGKQCIYAAFHLFLLKRKENQKTDKDTIKICKQHFQNLKLTKVALKFKNRNCLVFRRKECNQNRFIIRDLQCCMLHVAIMITKRYAFELELAYLQLSIETIDIPTGKTIVVYLFIFNWVIVDDSGTTIWFIPRQISQ